MNRVLLGEIIVLSSLIAVVFIAGCASESVENASTTTTAFTGTTVEMDCSNLYWFDNEHKECGYKKFCGAYMYLGLRTFPTLSECEAGLSSVSGEDYITLTSYPSEVNANSFFVVNWYVNSTPGATSNTAIYYGTSSVEIPVLPSVYPSSSSILCSTTPCNIPGPFTTQMKIATPGTYYFRAYALVSGKNTWSEEKIVRVTQPVIPAEKAFTIEADDYGFYINGSSASSLTVNRNDVVKITFMVKETNVYHSGLDFRGCGETASALPGQAAEMSFAPSISCAISSYWPSTGVMKSTFTVIVI